MGFMVKVQVKLNNIPIYCYAYSSNNLICIIITIEYNNKYIYNNKMDMSYEQMSLFHCDESFIEY